MAVIALRCPHYRVTVVDINEDKIRQWNSNNLDIGFDVHPVGKPSLTHFMRRKGDRISDMTNGNGIG